MSNKEWKFNSIEEMAEWVVSHPSYDVRFILNSSTQWVYEDPAAATKWEEERPEYSNYDTNSLEGRLAHSKAVDVWLKNEPLKNEVITWSLIHHSGSYSWRSTIIELSPSLGKALDKIWKTRPAYQGSNRMVYSGQMTLAGMLKRLGKTDITKQVKVAVENAKQISAKNSRNYARERVRKLAQEILELQNSELGKSMVWAKDITLLAEPPAPEE